MTTETNIQPESAKAQALWFFPVSPPKLFVMSIVTLGIYELFWFYVNWDLIKDRNRPDIIPILRAIFAPFFCYSLLRKVNESAEGTGVRPMLSPGWLTIAWIALSICWRLPDPFWLLSFLSVLALLPAQRVINEINTSIDPDHKRNSEFSGLNIVAIALGGLLLTLGFMSMFLTE